MRLLTSVIAACICLYGSSSFAADAPDDERRSGSISQEDRSIFDRRGSGERIDPDSVSGTLPGPSEADRLDTPSEVLSSFLSTLWVYFTSDTLYAFEHIEPTEAELDVVLEVARKSRVLAAELQRARKKSMCRQLSQYRSQGFTRDQSAEMAIDDYESEDAKEREAEEVASYIREDIETELGSRFLAALEREAEIDGEKSTGYQVSSRSFFGLSNEEFVANCEV